ncbi:type VI secretion system Vgr family protein [Isoalcanivorax indicus]|uniref:type VI secretion system Vgr family protein n=1 Tax=Isoalcanivorax indicus TaxID=2202653 RepID=UPI000DB9659D|nr:contractile injection system protein, VgrG/Pvc8 family [Isoalcanivorax indicus]
MDVKNKAGELLKQQGESWFESVTGKHTGIETFTFTVDGLLLDGYATELEEGLSQVSAYRVYCAVAAGSNSDALLGKAGRLTLTSRDALGRDIVGVVTCIDQQALLPDGREQWVFDMHSGLIRLSLRQRWRIVHRQSVVEIVENVFRDHGLAVDNRLTLDYPVKPWTAQVGESDLAFVQRLLAHADIWFSSESDEHGEVVVLADSYQGASRAQRAGLTVRAQSGAVRAIQGMESVALDGAFRRVGHADFYRQQQRESLHLSGPAGDVGPGQWLPVEGHGNCLIIHSKTTLALPREHQGNDPQPLRWEAEAIAFNQPFLPPIPAKPDIPLVFPARVESTEPYAQLTGSGLRKARIAFDEQLAAAGEASPPLRQLQPFGGPPTHNGQPTGWDWPLRDGADILLTCLNDDPDQPLILGYAPCTTQPGPVVGENRHQHKLMTPAGHQLALDDKQQAEAITLHTPDGRCLLKLDAQSDSPIVQLACDQGALTMRADRNHDTRVGLNHATYVGESQMTQVGQDARMTTDRGVIHHQAATDITLRAARQARLASGRNLELHSGANTMMRMEGHVRLEARSGMMMRIGGQLHLQADGAIAITGTGGGDLTIHQNGAGFSIKKDGTVRLFGNTVTIKGQQGVMFNGQMHYNLGQGAKADSPVPIQPLALTAIPVLKAPPPGGLCLHHCWKDGAPVPDMPYQIYLPGGEVRRGHLDSDGWAQEEDLPTFLPLSVHFGDEPEELDEEIESVRQQIAAVLEAIIAEKREETARLEKEMADASLLGNGWRYYTAYLSGAWDAATGAVEFVIDVLSFAGRVAHYGSPRRRLQTTLQSAWEASRNAESSESGWRERFLSSYGENEKDALVEALGFDPAAISREDLAMAWEITVLLTTDSDVQSQIMSFVGEYSGAMHGTDWAYVGGAVVFEIILTVVLIAVTGGVGAAARGAGELRHARHLEALSEPVMRLGDLLRRKRLQGTQRSMRGGGNVERVSDLPPAPRMAHGFPRLPAPENLREAVTRLGWVRQRLVRKGYQPKYSDTELRAMAASNRIESERFHVRIMPKRFVDSDGVNRGGALGQSLETQSGRGPKYWSTTFDQIEDADTDPRLLMAKLGLDPVTEPHVMVIIDTQAARSVAPTRTLVPTYEKLGDFASSELPRRFPADQVRQIMTPEFQAEYARHYSAARASGVMTDGADVDGFSRYLRREVANPDQRQLLSKRFEMQKEIGNNDHYLGNGLTRNLVEGVDNEFGAVETFNFQVRDANLKQFGDAIDIIDLMEITPR